MTRKWDIKRTRIQDGVADDVKYLNEILDDGWEPYAVSANASGNSVLYFFKREVIESSSWPPATADFITELLASAEDRRVKFHSAEEDEEIL